MSEHPPPDNVERRRARRQYTELPVELEKGAAATSRDISSAGIFFETEQDFAPGEPIAFAVMLSEVAPMPPIRLRCRGHIVRVERNAGRLGVAVAITESEAESWETSEPPKDA